MLVRWYDAEIKAVVPEKTTGNQTIKLICKTGAKTSNSWWRNMLNTFWVLKQCEYFKGKSGKQANAEQKNINQADFKC